MPAIDEESLANTQCPRHVELRWQAEVSSSIYASPLIADINRDGKLEIVVPAFVHYLEVLDGADGEKLPGAWPAFHKSSVHTSPLLHDVNADGVQEIALATYNGEVLFFSPAGHQLAEKLVVPRLRVKRDWYVGLDPDHVDHEHPDIHADIVDHAADGAPPGQVGDKEAGQAPVDKLDQAHGDTGEQPPGAGHEAVGHNDVVYQEGGSILKSMVDMGAGALGALGSMVGLINSTSLTQPTPPTDGPKTGADCADSGVLCMAKDHMHEHVDDGLASPNDTHGKAANGTELASLNDTHVEAANGTDHNEPLLGTHGEVLEQPPAGEQAVGVGTPPAPQADDVVKQMQDFTEYQKYLRDKEVYDAWQQAHQQQQQADGAAVGGGNTPPVTQQQQAFVEPRRGRNKPDMTEHGFELPPDKNERLKLEGGHIQEPRGGQPVQPEQAAGGAGGQGRRRLLQEATAENEQEGMDDEAIESFDVFKDNFEEPEEGEEGAGGDEDDPALHQRHDEYQYDDYDEYRNDDLWADEAWDETERETDEAGTVAVDAHILCTPVIADIDKDGTDEMVVAATYFFDREYYEDPAHQGEVDKDITLNKYVACAIVVFNLATQQVKWQVHLDLTTDSTQYRAYIYSAPTVVDLDGDGSLDIIVGTSVGFIYCLDHTGHTRDNFPIQLGEVQGQVVVSDINDDGKLELVAADTRGNIATFDIYGKEVWERHVGSLIAQGATVGDVNGDGSTEVVLGTTSGHIYVMRGANGMDVGGFPFRTHGRVMAPVLLVDLGRSTSSQSTALALVVTSFDGYLYIIDGATACADAIDVGETSYSMVLADNVDGGDGLDRDLDLVVTTMNGNVYCFQTLAPYHPLKAWPSQLQGRNVVSPRLNNKGIHFLQRSRSFQDISAEAFTVHFQIVDAKASLKPRASAPVTSGNYRVTVWLLLHGMRKRVDSRKYASPGVYSVRIPSPPIRALAASVMVEMEDEHGFYFHDEFALSFHLHCYRLLKWMVALPLLGMLFAIYFQRPPSTEPDLPSYIANRHDL
eukprot:SM000315S11901  [mRNA]  locus=s315:111541:117447:- [translate_table: standard]